MKLPALMIFMSLVVMFSAVSAAIADDGKTLQALQDKLVGLESELQQVKSQMNAMKASAAHATLAKAALNTDAKWYPVRSSLDIELYGYIKLDSSYDSARTNVGNFARWVESEQGRHRDSQFNMTANETRLGMKINGPATDSLKTSGRVEIDFYGGGAENKPNPMLRHAYMKIDFPQQRMSIIAGQTSDVISPLYPFTLNYSVAWWAGNIGYRRPQVRITKDIALAESIDLRLQGAITRTIGDDLTSGFDPGDTGEDFCLPGIQGRVAVTFPWFGPKSTTIGISSHWGREEYDKDAADTHENLDTWSVNLDVVQPVTNWLVVKGELYTGENLDAYLGGIGQGVNHTTVKEIGACGGWLATTLTPLDNWTFNVGASVEALDTDDIDVTDAIEDRTLNMSIFTNAIYNINENTSVGVEVSHWFTEYENKDKGGSLRLQGSFIYKF